ncbi:MAG: Z1 domain-containing protein [Steroidobacteraceae bacterium]
MSEIRDHLVNARNLAVDILRNERVRTPDLIRQTAEKAAQAQVLFDPEASVDVDRLTAELRHLFSVTAESATALDDATEHVPWLPSKRGSIQWRFWNRYVTYLERDFGMAPAVVANLDELTTMILERLEDPGREPSWDRRGMVVGSVQSGKTANYTGLICKALDAGYKLIIVLAGIHSNLRSQTQLRLDEGVLGFDTQKSRKLNVDNRWVGVGRLPGDRLVVHSLTSSAENGDFNKTMAETIGVMLGGDPVILVIKKNSRLLANLLKWVLHVAGSDEAIPDGRIVRNVPLLLIDDEADNASINTKAKPGVNDDDNVTAINGKIRGLLDAFEKSSYVGYTATPFANIFINPDAETPAHGEDLFPRSFIINVKPPNNYVGPARVFGLAGDPDAGIEARNGLRIVRDIDDFGDAFPPGHKIDHIPRALPESLKKAIRCFILTCAARRARGQISVHNSMLVHVTRFVNVQDIVVTLVRAELGTLQRRIEFGDGDRRPPLLEELRELWRNDYAPTSSSMGDEAGAAVTWEVVRRELHAAASKIVVLPINGFAKEALDYKEHEGVGRSVIAIGGDKLSRGLTMEGLSISYFLRTSRMYDTLMQMGRWFGYRPGYLDLCRLFTTAMLRQWYRHIALAEEELRREFDYMVAAGLTPENYGLRVRTHPDGMVVTALNKMSHGRTLELSWAGVLAQTTHLPKDAARISANLRTTEQFLAADGMTESGQTEGGRWNKVPAASVAHYVEALQFPPASARASGERLAAFIRKQANKQSPELVAWTVVLVSNSQSADRRRIAGRDVGLITRTPENQAGDTLGLRKANILNPGDEALDFDADFDQAWFEAVSHKRELTDDIGWLHEQIDRRAADIALDLTLRWQETNPPKLRKPSAGASRRPNGRVLRILRRPQNGLLLIYPLSPPTEVNPGDDGPNQPTGLAADGPPIVGVALSFPVSATTLGVEYRVNRIWGAEIEEDSRYED